MGAWGVGSFDNDDAMDWVGLLDASSDLSIIEQSLRSILAAEGYIELPECASAIAAAEVITAVMGRGREDLPSDVKGWIARTNLTVSDELKQSALRAVQQIKRDSEMKELWEESNHFQAWEAVILDLESRLAFSTAVGNK